MYFRYYSLSWQNKDKSVCCGNLFSSSSILLGASSLSMLKEHNLGFSAESLVSFDESDFFISSSDILNAFCQNNTQNILLVTSIKSSFRYSRVNTARSIYEINSSTDKLVL